MKPRRELEACPHAQAWLAGHPEVAENLHRIIRCMARRYTGTNKGFIDHSGGFVDYLFGAADGDTRFSTAVLRARQKHVLVRFYQCSPGKQGRGRSKSLDSVRHGHRDVVDFPVAAGDPLDDLQVFLDTVVSFSGKEARGVRRALKRAQARANEELNAPIRSEEDGRERALRAIALRKGQGKFRKALKAAYARQCAVTGCAVEPLLEAAHIIPYNGRETNRVDNGLLLRADIHTLFDLGLLWVSNPGMKVQLARELHDTEYGTYHDQPLRLPQARSDRPHSEHLKSHAEKARELREARE